MAFHHQGGDLAAWLLLGSPGGDMERLRSAVPGLDASCEEQIVPENGPKKTKRNQEKPRREPHNIS